MKYILPLSTYRNFLVAIFLYCNITEQPHDQDRRDGDQVTVEVSVAAERAGLGNVIVFAKRKNITHSNKTSAVSCHAKFLQNGK